VVDFGQNSAGIVRTTVPACLVAGENITLYHGELLNHSPYTATKDGRVYRGNLRKAKARDVYIGDGGGKAVVWEPAFTQHGFRYVEVHGWPSTAPPLSNTEIEAWELHTAVVETGSFHSSSTLLNTIQTMCQWTARSNLMSIPTDCPQRDERRGWMGDAALGASINVYGARFRQEFTLEDVTNGIPLGWPLSYRFTL